MTNKSISPYPLRMSDELRATLEESAKANGKSLQSEIIDRLMRSTELFESDDERIRKLIREELKKLGK